MGCTERDKGNKDTIIVELPSPRGEQHIGIIDCADFEYLDKYMTDQGIVPTRIEFIVATHPHDDHILGMLELLKAMEDRGIPIGEFWDSGFPHKTDTNDDLQIHLKGHYSERLRHPKDDTEPIHYGDATITFLAPKRSGDYQNSGINNSSIVIHLQYKNNGTIIFGGDAQSESWGVIHAGSNRNLLGVGFLKVPHHGSRRGLSGFELVVDYINPRISVITGNKSVNAQCSGTHCFPHPIVVGNLRSVKDGIVNCTFDDGNIIVDIDGRGIREVRVES